MFIFYFSIFNLFHFFIFLIVSNSLYISREYKYRYIKLYIHKKHVRFIICFLSLTFICVSLIVISILIGFVRNVNCELCEGESYFVLITEDGFNQTRNMSQTIKIFYKIEFFLFFMFLNCTRLKKRIINYVVIKFFNQEYFNFEYTIIIIIFIFFLSFFFFFLLLFRILVLGIFIFGFDLANLTNSTLLVGRSFIYSH